MRIKVFSIILIPFLLFSDFHVEAATEENWSNKTIYYVMIDRFNNGDFNNDYTVNASDPLSYHGGDFEGIIGQLDYIKDMGFTTISLSPIFDNEDKGYHGLWVKDFYKPEEHFGSLDTFKKLVNEAHNRDMKVMLDFVVNSVGPNHKWLKETEKQPWFHELKGNDSELEGISGLPQLNHDIPEVKEYFINVAKWWIKETNIDGYKLNNVQNVSPDFWEELSKEVKKVDTDFFLMGDVRSTISEEIASFSRIDIDGFLDYSSNELLRTAFAKPDQPTAGLFSLLEANHKLYPSPNLIGMFMDNQWSERFTRDAVQNNLHPGSRWKLALTYLYTTPGIPIIYYGTEIALDGGLRDDNRRQMDFRTDKELIDYITKLGTLRNQLPSLTKGTLELIHSDNGMTVYKRKFEGETTVVAINNSSKSQSITIDEDQLGEDKELRGLLNEDQVKSKDGKYNLIIDRDVAEVYYLANKSGINIPYISALAVVYAAFIVFLVLLLKRRKRI